MKKFLTFMSFFLVLSCSQEVQVDTNPITACGCGQAQENLPWLKELIKKAETDQTGNYWGTIWLVKYKGQDLFVTNMMLGSGGIANYVFDCSGNHLVFKRGEGSYCPSDFVGNGHFYVEDDADFGTFFHSMKLDVVVYSTLPL